ncbi:MAG: poly-gamma-glutamate synthase PgsB [Candidatus Omnitrophota bacterium]
MNLQFIYAISILLIIIVWEVLKFRVNLERRKKIRTVINVNGIRGKSSVTRLLCFALKETGRKVMSKTTGTIPQIITVDGEVREISRGAYPNINEQLKIVKEAAVSGADILVIECMAVDPGYQKVAEEKMLMSDIGVITNVRNDHREVMGTSPEAIAASLCNTIPAGKAVFTAERKCFDIIRRRAEKKKAKIFRCRETASVSDEMMKPFPFLEQRENVALALDICNYLGVNDETALRGMYKTIPDPGVLKSYRFTDRGKWFEIVDAFAVNDPDSLSGIWDRMSKGFLPGEKKIMVFNCRRDRPVRSVDLAHAFKCLPIDVFITIGTGGRLFQRVLAGAGVPRNKLFYLGMAGVNKVFELCCREASEKNLVFCAGNVKGRGMEFMEYVAQKSHEPEKNKEGGRV